MAEALYALKRDLDMVTDEVQNLKKGYGTLDYIAGEIHHLRLEQDCQAAQMRRMEKTLLWVCKYLTLLGTKLGVEPPKE